MKKIIKSNTAYERSELGEGSIMLYEPEKATTYILNELMAFIFDTCDNYDENQIVDEIKGNFDIQNIDLIVIKKDLHEAIVNLLANGLIIVNI